MIGSDLHDNEVGMRFNRVDQILNARPAWLINKWDRVEEQQSRGILFAELCEQYEPHTDVYFFESMSGAKVMDSPFALYSELKRRAIEKDRQLVFIWSAGSDSVVPSEVVDDPDTFVVKRHTTAYIFWLCRAGSIVGNSVLPEYFVRRRGQKYLNTWHGVGFKALGRSKSSPLGAQGAVSNMLQATHLISPCRFQTDVHLDGYSMRYSATAEVLESGYPRIDQTLLLSDVQRCRLRSRLGIEAEQRIVLYAPTWRDGGFDTERLVADLSRLSDLGCAVVFLGHHMMMKHLDLSSPSFSRIIVPPVDLNTNVLLSIVDLVITDYSSIFFDVLCRRVPIVHYVYDYDTYSSDRGLAIGLEDLPGVVVRESEELLETVNSLLNSDWKPDAGYLRAVKRYAPLDDGLATQRVADWFFDCRPSRGVHSYRTGRPSLIFWAGRLDESSACDEYLHEVRDVVSSGKFDVTIFVARSVSKLPPVVDLLRELMDDVSVVVRSNYQVVLTPGEAYSREVESRSAKDGTSLLYDNSYRREYRRLFGDSKFDVVIPFSRLTYFWRQLMRFATR